MCQALLPPHRALPMLTVTRPLIPPPSSDRMRTPLPLMAGARIASRTCSFSPGKQGVVCERWMQHKNWSRERS